MGIVCGTIKIPAGGKQPNNQMIWHTLYHKDAAQSIRKGIKAIKKEQRQIAKPDSREPKPCVTNARDRLAWEASWRTGWEGTRAALDRELHLYKVAYASRDPVAAARGTAIQAGRPAGSQ